MMNNGANMFKEIEKISVSLATSEPDATGLSISPDLEQKRHLEHKLRRVISEMEYLERYNFRFSMLTRREKEIIKLIVSGFNNPQISTKLYISRRTVEQHRKNINKKLETSSLPEICEFAYAFDIV